MSSIDKLLIRGIRSFSPYQESIIEFYSPLTIIVGHNGAGKTTVIECLKYATCGDLPPNSKGGAFVHDPKISREVEVKGQIKLKFKNVRGQTMVCTRSMQSTQKKSKLEQKTLESLLSTTDPITGEPVSISSRCAEMDVEIPLQLGVSQSVLENVLFCHQEESFWPLSEPSVLKKKFDDIFAATRYTKALDTIKALRKELTGELKLEQQKLDFLKSDREKASKVRLEMEKNAARELDSRNRISGIETQLTAINETISRLSAELQNLASLKGELSKLSHDLELTLRSRDDVMKGLVLMEESEDQLQTILDELSRRCRDDQNILQGLQYEKGAIEQGLELKRCQVNDKSTNIGIMKAELERLRQKEASLKEQVAELCALLLISFSGLEEFALIKDQVEAQRRELLTLQNAFETKKKEQSLHLQQIGNKLSSCQEVKRIKRKALDDIQRKLAQALQQIDETSGAQGQIEELQIRQFEEESSLNSSKALYAAANYDERVQILGEHRKKLDEQIKELGMQTSVATRSAEIITRYKVKNSELGGKREIANKIVDELQRIEPNLNGLDAESLERKVEGHWRSKERELKILQDRQEKTNSKVALLQSKLEHAQNLIARKRTELQEKSKKLEAVCEGDENFSMRLRELEEEAATVNKELTSSLSSKETYEAFQRTLALHHYCPLCERKFDGQSDEDLFRLKLFSIIDSLPSQTLELRDRQKELERKLSIMRPLRSVNDDVQRLESIEISELELEIKNLTEEHERAMLEGEELNAELSSIMVEEKKSASLKKKAEELSKLLRDVKALEMEVLVLEKQVAPSGAIQSLPELQQQLSSLNEERNKIQQDLDIVTNESKYKQAEVSQREQALLRVKESIMALRLGESDVLRLEQGKRELEQQISSLKVEITSIEKDVVRLQTELEEQTGMHDEISVVEATKVKAAQERLYKIESLWSKLYEINKEVKQARSELTEERLENLVKERQTIEKDIEYNKIQLATICERIEEHNKTTSAALVQERRIRDNLWIREMNARIEALNNDINGMGDRLGCLDGMDASGQLRRQELRRSELLGERSGLFGELRQIADQTARLQHELDTDYRTTDEDYRTQYIKFNATMTAIEDLEKYAKALDQAIMKFHSYKMSEVNRIIKEIWTATYQGADIDTVEIRADVESATGAIGRTYNYRVVMCRGEMDLDMRGRSSAGQRVLASLIIRLALAETFGQHCGVIALDEPTTNLDRDNIESLANSLAEIIKMRSSQGNFQLIIITHDEEFVELLGRHECADYYWRVFKDQQQYSTIERQSFRGRSE